MVDIYETAYSFEALCQERGYPPPPLIVAALNVEREANILNTKTTCELYLAGNNKLISCPRLTDTDAALICDWLQSNQYVVGLDLRYNNFTDKGARFIAELIVKSKYLRRINLMCNDFGEKGAKALAAALHTNTTLKCLRLNGNKIDNEGGLHFAQALQVNTTLEALDIGDADLRTECLIALSTVLLSNRSLRALNISRPILSSLSEETTDQFARMMRMNQSLRELHLVKHDVWDFGMARLCENLCNNYTLTYLNLSCNKVSSDGAKELANLLKRDTCLKVIDLSYNRIKDVGAINIAEALGTRNTSLITLDVRYNSIAGRGLCALADCMHVNSTLTQLFMWGNDFSEESGCIAMKKLMSTGRLAAADTDVQPYVVDGHAHLAEVSHGIRPWYYWGPSYGLNALPELTRYVDAVSLNEFKTAKVVEKTDSFNF